MANPAQSAMETAAPTITKVGCAVCVGSPILRFIAENSELITGLSGIAGIICAFVGIYYQRKSGKRKR